MTSIIKKIKKKITFFDKQDIIFGFLIFILLPLIIFGTAEIVHLGDHEIVTKKIMPDAKKALDGELEMALEKTREALNEGSINKSIINNNSKEAVLVLNQLAEKYGLTTMVAVNKEGLAIARTPSPRTGDYVFQTTPWGQSAGEGKATTTIGIGRNFPLIINSAVPIFNDKEVAGALFGGYVINNQYAAQFKQRFLKPEQEVIFYSKSAGMTGTSFNNPETQNILLNFLNKGSDIVQTASPGLIIGHFKLENKIFHAGNIKLYNNMGNVGGMVILVPVKSTLPYLATGAAGLFALIILAIHLKRRHKNKMQQVIIFSTAVILIIIGIKNYSQFVSSFLYNVIKPKDRIYNSTIEFTPETDILELTKQQRIGVQITTGGEPINTARADIKFDPKLVKVEDILLTNSFCSESFVIEKEIDNKNGQATIACGKPGGFTGYQTNLADLIFQPLKIGQTKLEFTDNTQVLAHDGLGTNVLRTTSNGSYKIIQSTKKYDNEILLFSYTHPNDQLWYNQKNIHIDFSRPAGYENFTYEFDRNISTIPDGTKTATSTSIDLTADQDGVYYFHIAGKKQNTTGPVSVLKIRIDTTPPEPPTIKASATEINADEIVRFEFSHNGDNASGIQKNFYIKFNNGLWLPTLPQLYTPFEQPGEHTIYLKVFDNAGNFSTTGTVIKVH